MVIGYSSFQFLGMIMLMNLIIIRKMRYEQTPTQGFKDVTHFLTDVVVHARVS